MLSKKLRTGFPFLLPLTDVNSLEESELSGYIIICSGEDGPVARREEFVFEIGVFRTVSVSRVTSSNLRGFMCRKMMSVVGAD